MVLLYNAIVHTLDKGKPNASAIAIEGGHIVAVGGNELLAEFDGAKLENMGGRTILPGLIDAHIHLQAYALSLSAVDCEVPSKTEILERVSQRVKNAKTGEWISGYGWNHNTWGGEWPSATDLDAVAPDNPVFLTVKSFHAAWLNSSALKLAGINGSTPDPSNGQIQRDQQGLPTGILLEGAVKLAEEVRSKPDPVILADRLQQVIGDLWKLGLTGVHDFDQRSCFLALQILKERGGLQFRVVKSIPLDLLPQAAAIGLRTGFGDDMLRIGSVKLFADGALGPHTAAMLDPYVDEPKNRGILFLDNEQLFKHGRLAVESGLSLAVHAIGDRAIHEVLDGLSRLREYEHDHSLPKYRHRIEHVQTIHPDDAGRLGRLGVIASMQPSHAPSDMIVADRSLGGRAAFSYAWRTQLENGAILVFGSDAPVEKPNPFAGIHAAVTRRRADGSPGEQGWYPQQKLTVAEALKAFTTGPAYAAGMERYLGKLSPGYLADLIVVDADPFSCDLAEIYHIQPSGTMIAGKWVWQK